jgi:hypothetical protein
MITPQLNEIYSNIQSGSMFTVVEVNDYIVVLEHVADGFRTTSSRERFADAVQRGVLLPVDRVSKEELLRNGVAFYPEPEQLSEQFKQILKDATKEGT